MEECVQTEENNAESDRKLVARIDDTIPMFDNGLLKDIKFYSNEVRLRYIIAKKNKVQLSNEDFYTLNPKQELSNFLMEYICSIIVPNNIQVELYRARDIVENNADYMIKFTKKILLLPLLKDGHWVLFIIDFEKQTFAYLNSCPKLFRKKNFFQTFLKYIEKHSKKLNLIANNTDAWTEKSYEIHGQKDNYNSGVHVIDYIKEYVRRGTVSKRNFCADSFREKIKWECIEGSDDMRSVCLVCSKECQELMQCNRCLRRIDCGVNAKRFVERGGICPVCHQYEKS